MRRINSLILSVAIFFATLSQAAKYTYCNNEHDYKVHMELHRIRIVLIATYLFYSDPTKFPGVDEYTLVDYISTQHDSAKLDLSSLIAKRLMQFYGTPYDKHDPDDKEALRNLVAYINKTDEVRRAKYFKKKNITSQKTIDSYLALETIGDLIDRSYDPVAKEEFGRDMYPASESSNITKSVLPLVKSFELEGRKKYEGLTKGFEFPIGDGGVMLCFLPSALAKMKMRLETIRFQLGYR